MYTHNTHLGISVAKPKLGVDQDQIQEVYDVCQEVVGNEPAVMLRIDVEGKPERNANCVVENTKAYETRPEVEKVSLKLRSTMIMR